MYACLHADGNLALLAECARYFSPRFEESSAKTVVIDLQGSSLLFGSSNEIAAAMSSRAGVAVDVAIACDPDTAEFAARGFKGVTIVPPGMEKTTLSPLPLNLLSGSPEAAAILNAWGIRTFGEFAALPTEGVAARLGSEGLYLQRLVRGKGNRQLRPVEESIRFREEFELESPIELMESLSFFLWRLLNNLCGQLTASSLSTDEIRLLLKLENAPLHSCILRLPAPMRDPKVFLKLLQLELNSRPPAAAILKILLELLPVEPRTEQHNLFLAAAPEPAKLEITLSKLSNLVGAENVGKPEVLNTHRPDSFQMNRFTVSLRASESPVPCRPALILRRFRPPTFAQVTQKNEQPVHVRSMSLKGSVLACAGPWRSSGDWWKADPWNWQEWDIAFSDGAIYRLREDWQTKHWFVEGVYD